MNPTQARIVTLTMNPAIDVAASVARMEPFRKLRCAEDKRDAGGGGINVARAVQRLGGAPLALYPAGGPTGDLLRRLVAEAGVADHVIPMAGDTREDVTIFDRATGGQYRFVFAGPRLDEPVWRACLDALAMILRPGDHLVASGSLPEGVPVDFYARAGRIATRAGAPVSIDTSDTALAAALEAAPFIIKPNQRELEHLVGRALPAEADQVAAARDLIGRGAATYVALSRGEAGALLVGATIALSAPAIPVTPVSTVGAGDSFLAALVLSVQRRLSLEDAFAQAVAAGTAALLAPGTALCHQEDVARLAGQVRISAL